MAGHPGLELVCKQCGVPDATVRPDQAKIQDQAFCTLSPDYGHYGVTLVIRRQPWRQIALLDTIYDIMLSSEYLYHEEPSVLVVLRKPTYPED